MAVSIRHTASVCCVWASGLACLSYCDLIPGALQIRGDTARSAMIAQIAYHLVIHEAEWRRIGKPWRHCSICCGYTDGRGADGFFARDRRRHFALPPLHVVVPVYHSEQLCKEQHHHSQRYWHRERSYFQSPCRWPDSCARRVHQRVSLPQVRCCIAVFRSNSERTEAIQSFAYSQRLQVVKHASTRFARNCLAPKPRRRPSKTDRAICPYFPNLRA